MNLKIFFKGYYGFENLGDDIFVHTIKWFANKNGYSYKIHGYNLPENTKGKKVRNKIEKNLFDIYYALTCKRIIYWGGSTFEKNSSKTDLKYYIMRIKFLRKKMLATGISIGPFKSTEEEKLLLDYIKDIDYVGVRDKKSMSYDKSFEFTFDLAILTPQIFNIIEKEVNKKKVVNINISNAKNLEEYQELYKRFLINNKKQIKKINVIVFNPSDYEISNKFYLDIKQYTDNVSLVKYTKDTMEMLKVIANSDLMLGNRLHSGIISYAYDIPFILNEYHEKCTDFVKTVEQKYDYKEFERTLDKGIDHVIEQASNNKKSEYFRRILYQQLEKMSEKIK